MASNRRTQVEAIDDLTTEIRVANAIAALALGPSGLDEDTTTKATTPAAVERLARKNALRAFVRAGLGIEGKS